MDAHVITCRRDLASSHSNCRPEHAIASAAPAASYKSPLHACINSDRDGKRLAASVKSGEGCKDRRSLRLRLRLQRSNEFQSKTVSATVADDGHHPQATRNPELDLQ